MYAQPLLQAQSPHAFLQTKSLILVLIPSHFIKLLKTSILKHHLKLTSDAVHHRLIRDLVAVVPSRLRELIFLKLDLVRSIELREESDHLRVGECPWLALIIADVLDLQSDLLHDLTVDRLLKALPDLHETGDQRVSAVRVVVHAVSGH